MTDNQPFLTHTHNDLTIEGYSRAAVQTYWRIPELKMGFDVGGQPWDFMGTPTWFISHTHLDHIAALPVLISRRRMMKMEPPTIFVPARSIDNIKQMLHSFTKLDRGRLPCDLIPTAPGDEIELNRETVVTVIETKHTIPSMGFVVWERRQKLKPEYVGLAGDEIRDIRKQGKEVTSESRFPRLAFMGDSAPEVFEMNPVLFEAKVLICEMTFVAPDHRSELIHKQGHTHLDDFVSRRDQFQNELIIASHFSTRYHERQIKRHVERALPDMLDGRLKLWV